jgi:hypothetical protein
MSPCPHCGRPTPGTVDGDVTHATCPACTEAATGRRHLPRSRPQARKPGESVVTTGTPPEKEEQS